MSFFYQGPVLLSPQSNMHHWGRALSDEDDEHEEYELGLWWLAISPDGTRLVLIRTRGVTDARYLRASHGYPTTDNIVYRHGRHYHTYENRFSCQMFLMDTTHLLPQGPWQMISNLGPYSLFLGLNYPITIPVGGANLGPEPMTRSNCVYTTHHALGLDYVPRPEVCRFSLNVEDATVGISTDVRLEWGQTPLWSIPSLANALEWSRMVGRTQAVLPRAR